MRIGSGSHWLRGRTFGSPGQDSLKGIHQKRSGGMGISPCRKEGIWLRICSMCASGRWMGRSRERHQGARGPRDRRLRPSPRAPMARSLGSSRSWQTTSLRLEKTVGRGLRYPEQIYVGQQVIWSVGVTRMMVREGIMRMMVRGGL